MQLVAFELEGYRRFVSKTSVKLHGDLIAFVGPNEAGKSSLLRAISHLDRSKKFELNERPRRTDIYPRLTWHFQLDAEDKAALSKIMGADEIERVLVSKRMGKNWGWSLRPKSPVRERSLRAKAYRLLRSAAKLSAIKKANADSSVTFFSAELTAVRGLLNTDIESYSDGQIAQIQSFLESLENVEVELDEVTAIEDLTSVLNEVIESESGPSPWRKTVDILSARLPVIEFFSEEDRNLASEYDLEEVANDPPRALSHLASLANLDLVALLRESQLRAIADVSTRRNAANKMLREAFGQTWNQQRIAIQFDVQGTILYVQVTTPGDDGLSTIEERSEGMRWFASLLAYSRGRSNSPILLVDEIERHLHYDAQADLIDVLAKQTFASKVIYTTHSLGCLPYDLGAGVRIVRPLDSATSKLENGFWKGGAGFSPLMVGMGAAAMSFTPARHAIISEGPADAILLPTLLRQASGSGRLGFQVVPGLSGVAAASVQDLEVEAGRVGFIVDGDKGGKDLVAKLQGVGVSSDRIVVLKDDQDGLSFETEDFIDPEIYLDAVNSELRCWGKIVKECEWVDLSESFRTKALDTWCKNHGYEVPSKTAIAQRVVEYASESDIFYSTHRDRLNKLLADVKMVLNIE